MSMAANSKTPWPATFLGRLQAVIDELSQIGEPTCATVLTERFRGVTQEQIENTLEALLLFGKVERKGALYTVPEEPSRPESAQST